MLKRPEVSVAVACVLPAQYTLAPVMGFKVFEVASCSLTEPVIRCADIEKDKRRKNAPERYRIILFNPLIENTLTPQNTDKISLSGLLQINESN
jgi:hypothetical protein